MTELIDCTFKLSDTDELMKENEALKAEIESLKSLSLVKVLEQKDSVIVKQEECNDWLRAENARLQSIIDEANAQEPIYQWRLEDDGWMDCTKEWFEAAISAGYEKRILYATPIPAQQSPAVVVPDIDDGLLPISAHDHPDCHVMYWTEPELRSIKDYAKRCIAAKDKSPRITEQDVREIVESFGATLCDMPLTYDHVDIWLKNKGRAILEKLNK